MKPSPASALISIVVITASLLAAIPAMAQGDNTSAASPNIDALIGQVRQATQSANADIARLQIERWKSDSTVKQQMQQMASSLKKNLTFAVPDLISDVQTSKGSVSSTFRLYHNLNVVYEYMNSLADAAGTFGKKEEYEPLNGDLSALDTARQGLSSYIEQAAARLEKPKPTPTPAPTPTPKKLIIDDATPTPKPKSKASNRKKKTSATPTPTPKPSPQ